MYGDKGVDLIKEAARAGDSLVPFNEDSVRFVLEEIRSLFESNRLEVAEAAVVTPSVNLRHYAIERNKRCVLAYINNRVNKLRAMRWQFGAVLPDDIRMNMCEPEQQFFSSYSKLLAQYMKSVGTDITTDLCPPKSLFIEVRVKQDYGELETPDGDIILLKAGSHHNLPRDLCEQLIVQGVLEHVLA